jgi:hypothetical protein
VPADGSASTVTPAAGSVERSHDETRLLGGSLTFEQEQPVATDGDTLHERQAHQRDEALVP